MAPLWYEQPSVAHRLGHPFVFPGGPSVVVEAAASTPVTVQQFHNKASSAWQQLVSNVEHGLHEQVDHGTNHTAQQQWHCNASATRQQAQPDEVPAAQQPQQQLCGDQQQPQQRKPPMGLDLSGLLVPLLGRKRLTGPVLLVPQSAALAEGTAAQQPAAAAATAAQQGHTVPMQTLEVPPGCLRLHSWQESAAAKEPPGVVASAPTIPDSCSLTAAAVDYDVLQPGSEVVVTLAVLDTGRRLNAVQQEIQALGSNTLMDVRRTIRCPTDKLMDGLGASNPAAYFYIDGCFYDDTSATAAAECSGVVEQWLQQMGMPAPKMLLHKFETPDPAPRLAVVNTGREQQQQDGANSKDTYAGCLQPLIGNDYAGDTSQILQPQESQDKINGMEDQQQHKKQTPRRDQDQHHSAHMQDIKLHDLVLQASNRPMALYSHQGLCEHAIIVTDVRLLHAADPSRRSCYPRSVHRAVLARRMHCGVCKRVGATTLVLDHPETPEALTMLCKLCCGLFDVEHYPEAKFITFEGY